ncbi:MAG TPA: penicillin-binding transpeptidase domain-containing protein [Pyrinomonadaceae bacterium]|nr:penicillin-binding transpeptidase domain-containing protein [Pyrinomonadaceae bacterium]
MLKAPVKCLLLTLCVIGLLFADVSAQAKKPISKKAEKTAKDAKKESKTAKDNKSAAKDSKSAKDNKSAKDSKSAKDNKSAKNSKETAKDKNAKDKKDTKQKPATAKQTELNRKEAEKRKAEEAKRREAEEERRQAILAEQRRREQARREAEAKRLAFERSLRTETVENIVGDKTEGEDLQIRRAAVEALGNRAGTVVVMEAQTGKVLTVVNQDWGIRKGFKPCSTIKLVTGVAGVNEELIDEEGNLRKQSFKMNLDDALAYSNNSYFQKVGTNLGSGKMISYAKALGLGEQTGINAEGETDGKLPYGNENARIYSHGDDFEVTPLQLAVMVSAITNGGKLVVPQTPRNAFEKTNFRGAMRREVNLPKKTLQGVMAGMLGASEYGTARRAANPGLTIAGKTGSCIGQGTWVGLFASVAPAVNPKYAVVVITRGQSERGKFAAAIAGKIYQSLRPRFEEKKGEMIAAVPLEIKPNRKINAQTSVKLDEGEGEDSDDGDALKSKPAAKKGETRKTEQNPTPKTENRKENASPLFSPVIIDYKRDVPDEVESQKEKPAEVKPQITRPRVVN